MEVYNFSIRLRQRDDREKCTNSQNHFIVSRYLYAIRYTYIIIHVNRYYILCDCSFAVYYIGYDLHLVIRSRAPFDQLSIIYAP